MYSDNIEGEWGAFNDIIKRKDSSIQTQVASLQLKIVSEDKVVEEKTSELLGGWEKEKPIEVSKKLVVVFLKVKLLSLRIKRLHLIFGNFISTANRETSDQKQL